MQGAEVVVPWRSGRPCGCSCGCAEGGYQAVGTPGTGPSGTETPGTPPGSPHRSQSHLGDGDLNRRSRLQYTLFDRERGLTFNTHHVKSLGNYPRPSQRIVRYP